MIICSASTFSANAVMAEENDTVIEATVNLGNENELQPMATSGCESDYHHIFDNPRHNLTPFLNSYGGNQAAAYGAVLSAGQSYVTAACISGVINAYNQITVVCKRIQYYHTWKRNKWSLTYWNFFIK